MWNGRRDEEADARKQHLKTEFSSAKLTESGLPGDNVNFLSGLPTHYTFMQLYTRDTHIFLQQQVLIIVDDTDETPLECVERTVGFHVQRQTVDRLKNLLKHTRHSIWH